MTSELQAGASREFALPPILIPYTTDLPTRDVAEIGPVEKVWRKEFRDTAKAIPATWLIRCGDGFVGILPEYSTERIVMIYREVRIVGYAKGWML